jgi:hypothetical protein
MVVNRLQKDRINSRIAVSASRVICQNIFVQMGTHTFFSNSERDFYSENNNVSEIYTYIPKKKKKIQYPICYYLSFVFPVNLIWLLVISITL